MKEMARFKTVDEYIAAVPSEHQAIIKQMRATIKKAAPGATEKISYGMPYYNLNGRLLYFGASKDHIGLYPMKSALEQFKKELTGYQTSPGTVRFPLNKPLPLVLVSKMVKFRLNENLAKKKQPPA